MTSGQALTLWAVRAACVAYAVAVTARLVRRPAASRVAWTAGCLFFVAHVAAAFGFYHAWSHDAAYRETARQTAEVFGVDWGGGLYFNYAFTVVWVMDVCWMWMRSVSYASRPPWITAAVHAFMGFMFFNATVVFGSTPVRWTGAAVSAALLSLLALKLRARRGIGLEVAEDKLHAGEKESR